MFTITFITTATLGVEYDNATGSVIGMTSAFASTGITGVIAAFMGGQPLVLYGQTGPVQLVYLYMFEYCRLTPELPFHGFIGWTAVWTFIFHIIIALTNMCDYKRYITRFTSEIFEMLVAFDFLTKAMHLLVQNFQPKYYPVLAPPFVGGWIYNSLTGEYAPPVSSSSSNLTDSDPSLIISGEMDKLTVNGKPFPAYTWALVNGFFSFLLAFGFLYTALSLSGAGEWRATSHRVRQMMKEFGPLIALGMYDVLYEERK